MTFKMENIIEITWIIKEYALAGNLQCIPFDELKEIIDTLSDKFEKLNCNTDWNELDYEEEICNFTNKEIALELWHRFGDVPMNPETERIEEDWNGFIHGTFREDIWHWFEKTFYVSVAEDLMSKGDNMLGNIWRYSLNDGECGGIVIANTQEEAEQKVKEMYEDWDGGQENQEDVIKVWKAILDDEYSKDYPDVLEIY